jgi:hypothetical protein
MTFLATASGLMMERVRSIVMYKFSTMDGKYIRKLAECTINRALYQHCGVNAEIACCVQRNEKRKP